jgi:hypothetical protein
MAHLLGICEFGDGTMLKFLIISLVIMKLRGLYEDQFQVQTQDLNMVFVLSAHIIMVHKMIQMRQANLGGTLG